MKTYSVTYRMIKEGIDLISDQRLGLCVGLGESGRGRELTLVKLDRRSTPEVRTDGACPRVHEAGVIQYEAGGQARHALAQPAPGDKRALVRISTAGPYTRHTYGRIVPYWGEPVRVTGGHGAHGDAGRLGTWADDLWIISPGQALFIQPSGGDKVSTFILYHSPAGKLERWDVEAWRAEVVGRWKETATDAERASALALAEQRGNKSLVALLQSEAAAVRL